jgi:hypothetical protein
VRWEGSFRALAVLYPFRSGIILEFEYEPRDDASRSGYVGPRCLGIVTSFHLKVHPCRVRVLNHPMFLISS